MRGEWGEGARFLHREVEMFWWILLAVFVLFLLWAGWAGRRRGTGRSQASGISDNVGQQRARDMRRGDEAGGGF